MSIRASQIVVDCYKAEFKEQDKKFIPEFK